MDASSPIGLFDSGVGGLTVFKALRNLLPFENLVYLGDTARVPYGTKSAGTITRYTLMAARKLASHGVKMIVVACNTATSAALPHLVREFAPIPVIGVIEPGALAATRATKNGCIGVIATEATINGNAYQAAIRRLLPAAQVSAKACTLLVPLAEEGWLEGEIAEGVLTRYLEDMLKPGPQRPDTMLLGCTHFPLFTSALQKIAGPDITIVDSANATATVVRETLARAAMLNHARKDPQIRLLTTDNPARFARTGGRFLGNTLKTEDIELVDLQADSLEG